MLSHLRHDEAQAYAERRKYSSDKHTTFSPQLSTAGMIQLLEADVWHPTSNHTDASNIDLATKKPTKLKTEYEQNY